MGHTEFLVGKHAPLASDLSTSIADLEDKSTLFCSRWRNQDVQRAGAISQDAMILLDFIAAELLREKVERKGLSTYSDSVFATRMNLLCASGVTGTCLGDQQAMVETGPGQGRIPPHLSDREQLTLDRLLNKIKHRNRRLVNFRIEENRHIFVICPEHTHGGPEGIYEFDVVAFCEHCKAAAYAL